LKSVMGPLETAVEATYQRLCPIIMLWAFSSMRGSSKMHMTTLSRPPENSKQPLMVRFTGW
jgi:hypothetical protein